MSKIISYCLWGNDDLYCKGALRNIELATKFFPEFTCRFYVAKDFDKSKIEQLEKNSNVVVVDEIGSPQMMMYRFLPIGEDVQIFMSRDTDSRIGIREQCIVNEWIVSDKKLHIIRDHPYHDVKMLGGMWGLKDKIIDVQKLIYQFKQSPKFKNIKGVDQTFLWDYIYPLFAEFEIFRHDDHFGGVPIKINRYDDVNTFFIGQPIGIDKNENDFEMYSNDRNDIEKAWYT